MTRAVLTGGVLTAELGDELYRATVSTHAYLDEQVHCLCQAQQQACAVAPLLTAHNSSLSGACYGKSKNIEGSGPF